MALLSIDKPVEVFHFI